MNSKQFSSKYQTNLTCDSLSEQNTPSEEMNFPLEQISFDFTHVDQPIVTIEYDDGDNQHDPLAVDETVDITNHVNSPARKRKIMIYHPFSQQVEERCELSPSRSPDSFYQPPKVARCSDKRIELLNSDQEEVVLVSDDDDDVPSLNPKSGTKAVQSEAAGTQTEFPDENKKENVDNNQSKSLLVDQLDEVEDNTSKILMKELAEQLLQKMEERRLAANHLRQKRLAETALAKQLVRQIMKPGSQVIQDSPESVGHAAPLTPKQQKDTESALARRLVQQMSKGCSLKETVLALRSTTPSSKLPPPANIINRSNESNVSGKPVRTGAPVEGTTRGPPDKVKQGPQRMEAHPHNHGPCFACCNARWLNQSKTKSPNIQNPTPRPEASSSGPCTLEPALPSYSVAFGRDNNKQSANEGFVEGLGDQRFPVGNLYRSFSPHVHSSYLPISTHRAPPQCTDPPPSPTASGRLVCPSPLSAVHPSHLLPPSSLVTATVTIDDELEDLIVPVVTGYYELLNPPNISHSEAPQYLEPSSSISRTPAKSLLCDSPETGSSQRSYAMRHQAQISVQNQLQDTYYSPIQPSALNQTGCDVSLDQLRSDLQQKLEAVHQLQRIRDHQRRFENEA